jgi:hypothetical protein
MLYRSNTERFTFDVTTTGGTAVATGDTIFQDTEYHQVVGVYNGSTVDIYVDGEDDEAGTRALTGTLIAAGSNLAIGSEGGASLRAYDGVIEYVYIYERALSAFEIRQLWQKPFCMFKEDLPVSMMYSYAAAAPPSGQVIFIQMSAIPLILIPALVFMFRRKF